MAKPKLCLIPAAQGGKLYSVLPSSGVGDFQFSRSGSATRINSQGLIETVSSGVSRLNYPMIDGVVKGCPSHILEPQRLQKIQYSEDFSNAAWSKFNITVEANSTISPDGTLNATKVLEQVDSANGHFMFDNLGLTPSVEYNFSIFVKKLNRRYVALQNSYNTANGSIAFFDLDTETLVYTYSAGTVGTFVVSDAKIEKYPNGWYRLSANFQSSASTGVLPSLVLADSQWSTGFSYNNLYTGDVTKGIYIWGAQLEQGSYPTSYIPNYGTAAGVTRSAETANGAGDAATFNSEQGVLMAEISALADIGSNQSIAISDGSINNRILFRYNSTNQIRVIVISNTSFVFDKTLNISSINEYNKFVIKYKQDDFALWVNGFELGADNSGVTPTGLNELALDDGSGVNDFYGNTKQIQYFDTALTDSELEKLTSWVSFQDMAEGQLYTIE